MADSENEFEFVGPLANKSTAAARANGFAGLTNIQNYGDVASLRARLAAINGAYFTAARLNGMTKNDMLYALRLADDPGSVR